MLLKGKDLTKLQLFDVLLFWESGGRGYYNVIIPFICRHCGRCCKNLGQWDPYSIGKVSRALGHPETVEGIVEFINKYLGSAEIGDDKQLLIKLNYEQKCPFLTKENLCLIYSIRPEGCALYPFVFSSDSAREIDCPGIIRFDRMFY